MRKAKEIDFDSIVSFFKALSDETRLKILYLLKKKPLCVCELMGTLDITQTKTSRHLIYLKNAGILTSSKEDRWMVYRFREDLPGEVTSILDKTLSFLERTGQVPELESRLRTILSNESIYRQTHGIDGCRMKK
jgi:DNA-binding transcriptional ArsR family regulator